MTASRITFRGAVYRLAAVESERRDLAIPVLRTIYQDVTKGALTLEQARRDIDDYVAAHVEDALSKPEEYFETGWDLLRDVLAEAAREELVRSTTSGVEANWSMLEEWMVVEEGS